VSELIDPERSIWRTELVRQTFTQEDAADILSIPICQDADDFVAWHFDTKGIFPVKSAYRAHMVTQELKASNPSECLLMEIPG
jgi:hypothetical protein